MHAAQLQQPAAAAATARCGSGGGRPQASTWRSMARMRLSGRLASFQLRIGSELGPMAAPL